MKKFLILSFVVLAFGCASTKHDILDDKPTLDIIEAPPRVEWIIPPEVSIPPEPVLQILSWTTDQIKDDPVGYEEALYSDLIFLDDFVYSIREYLIGLAAAREKAIAAATLPPE